MEQTTKLGPSSLVPFRTGTPTLLGEDATGANLSALESALKVASNPGTQLPELVTARTCGLENATLVPVPTDDDNISSVCEELSLPGGRAKVHFLSSQGEAESSEEASQAERFKLYGRNPVDSESGTEGGKESGFEVPRRGTEGTIDATAAIDLDSLPQLSGRSRAQLKRYFEEIDAFWFPEGHPVLAFTESQVYNLLRVLTDETIRMSYTTMERMVLDAVKGHPLLHRHEPLTSAPAIERRLLGPVIAEAGVLQTRRAMRPLERGLRIREM